jgi:tetratricopeptide (TPR) repeat protein
MLEGRDGIGKTAMLRRLRDHPKQVCRDLHLDGFVYLSGRGYRWVTTSTLLADIARVADTRLMDEPRPWRLMVDDVLASVRGTSVVVVVDDADDLFDPAGELKDIELRELFLALASRVDHDITLVMCVQRHQATFLSDIRQHGQALPLDRGLPGPWARYLLHRLLAVDEDDPAMAGLDRLCNLTDGHPRILELLVGLLRTSAVSADDLAVHLQDRDHAAQTMLRLVFEELGPSELRAVQALAVYSRPVEPEAIDHLLAEVVRNPDSSRALNALTASNLVHRRGNYYYLPAVPDAAFILDTILDSGATSTGLDKPTLWGRAAEYFHAKRVRPVRSTDDLWPTFGEIELHLRIGEATGAIASFRSALELIDEVDDRHLRGWGQSHILVPWRRTLRGNLQDPTLELRNISYLVAARLQQDGHSDDVDELNQALRQATNTGNERDRFIVGEQLANALFNSGKVTVAGDLHRLGVAAFQRLQEPSYEAPARMELAICLIKGGDFTGAEAELRHAWRLVKPLPMEDSAEVRSEVLQNAGWAAAQLGRDDEALELLDQAFGIVGRSNESHLGALHNAKAAVYLYCLDLAAAIEHAEMAARIGTNRTDYVLTREAYVNLALAHLLKGPDFLADAIRAADAAAGYSNTPQALGALGIQGLVAFRIGDLDKARVAFLLAFSKSDERFSRDERDFQMLDARGLILCGLALLRERDVQDAVCAYEAARAITRATGVVKRSRIHLSLFGPHADPAMLAKVRRAASGRTAAERDWS